MAGTITRNHHKGDKKGRPIYTHTPKERAISSGENWAGT